VLTGVLPLIQIVREFSWEAYIQRRMSYHMGEFLKSLSWESDQVIGFEPSLMQILLMERA
jgi:hypothetical protein